MRKERLVLIIGENKTPFSNIEKEYQSDIFTADDTDIIYQINRLPTHEKRLLILYAELGSMQKVAKIYNCSKVTIWKQIEKIRRKLTKNYYQ